MEKLFDLLIARRIDIRLHHTQHPYRSRSFLFLIPQLIGAKKPRKRPSDLTMHVNASRIHLPKLPAGERTPGIRRLPIEAKRTRDIRLRPIALGEAHRHAKEAQRIAAHSPLHIPGKCLLIISRRRAHREMRTVKIPDRRIRFIDPRLDRLFQPGECDVSHLDHPKRILTHEHPCPVCPPVDPLLEAFAIETKGRLIIPLAAKTLLTHLSKYETAFPMPAICQHLESLLCLLVVFLCQKMLAERIEILHRIRFAQHYGMPQILHRFIVVSYMKIILSQSHQGIRLVLSHGVSSFLNFLFILPRSLRKEEEK